MLYIIMNKNICCGLEETCFRCDRGWKLNKRKCYYFSKDRLSWNESKVMCMNQSGNLVKITSKDEQVQKHTSFHQGWENEDKFWIGLTDAAKEGEWRWVDGSKLNEDPRCEKEKYTKLNQNTKQQKYTLQKFPQNLPEFCRGNL
uniref:C-type lectin domain-containing protein n=1 Tax=Gouania willdenowi TaxID=441366 RepID=A0A8C5DRW5_GOUWI